MSPSIICGEEHYPQAWGYGTMTTLHYFKTPVAITCLHCVRNCNVGDLVYFSDRTHLGSALIKPFGSLLRKVEKLDVAFIDPYPGMSMTVNFVKFLDQLFHLQLNRDWCYETSEFDENHRYGIFVGRTIYKVGATTGLTQSIITSIDGDFLYTHHTFSAEGDSGSLVFTESNGDYIILGVIKSKLADIEYDNLSTGQSTHANTHSSLLGRRLRSETEVTELMGMDEQVEITGIWAFFSIFETFSMGYRQD